MQLLRTLLAAALLLSGASAAPGYPLPPAPYTPSPQLYPVIDLGYVKQQATEYNATGGYYIFRNIRFAAPPVGELRLQKPQPPVKETTVQNGNYSRITACSQPNGTSGLLGSEDCLFLDVYVPTAIAEGLSFRKTMKKVPVLAWWYGGGFITGSNQETGSPAGLYQQATSPFIFVAANYRIGALGFLAPPDGAGVPANLGLHDTQMALDWIGSHIEKFGGDKEKVTVMGLSAGGAVLMHAITAYGGKGPKQPFQQAILQSPGWLPEANPAGRLPLWEAFKANTGCKDIECIRKLPTEKAQAANVLTVGMWLLGALGSTSGLYPVVDGDYVPDIPINLLAEDRFHKEIRSLISSSTRWEGGAYVPANITDAGFKTLIQSQYSTNTTIIDLLTAEYPFDGTPQGAYRRAVEAVGDLGFNCNGYWLARSFSAEEEPGHHSRRYMFNLGAAIHGTDAAYTWDQGGVFTVASPALADQHQKLIVDYATRGDVALKNWPEWSEEQAKAMWLNSTGLAVGDDFYAWAINVDRCEFLKEKIIGKG